MFPDTPYVRCFCILLALACGWNLGIAASEAQVTSSGLNTQVTTGTIDPAGRQPFIITGGTRPGNGPNLFHSFGDFSVASNEVARFFNDSGQATNNILSRVTGGNVSSIFGEINTTTFPGANLYLINPAGVVFGPTASLNVSGSVNVSTADYLRLADGVRFNAVPGPQDALLSTAPVIAFGFLKASPQPIEVQGATLEVRPDTPTSPGNTLALVGGDITISQGTLTTLSNGQVQLISVASQGEVNPGTQPSIGPRGGVVTLTDSLLQTNGGEIEIRGGQLLMDNATLRTAREPSPLPIGGVIRLHATDTIRADQSHMTSQAGSVSLEAGEAIHLTGSTVGTGGRNARSGTVDLTANVIRLNDTLVDAHSEDDPGGAVTMRADQVRLENGSQIDARSIPFFSGSLPNETGGSVTIHANRVTSHNASILAGGAAGGGTVVINATETVRLDDSHISTELFNPLNPGARQAGTISIQAGDTVRLLNGTVLSADTGAANAGDIVIEAGNRIVNEGSTVSAESTGGNGGNIIMQAGDRMRVDNGVVSTSAQGDGMGGNISLSSDVIRLRDGTRVESTAVTGPGGTITIRANDYRNVNSTIDAGSQFGPDGSVTILPLTAP